MTERAGGPLLNTSGFSDADRAQFKSAIDAHHSLLALRIGNADHVMNAPYAPVAGFIDLLVSDASMKIHHALDRSGVFAAAVSGREFEFGFGRGVIRTQRDRDGNPGAVLYGPDNASTHRIVWETVEPTDLGGYHASMRILPCPPGKECYPVAQVFSADLEWFRKDGDVNSFASVTAHVWSHDWPEFMRFAASLRDMCLNNLDTFDTNPEGRKLSFVDIQNSMIADPVLADGGFVGDTCHRLVGQMVANAARSASGVISSGIGELGRRLAESGLEQGLTYGDGDDHVHVVELGEAPCYIAEHLEGLGDHFNCAFWIAADPDAGPVLNMKAVHWEGIEDLKRQAEKEDVEPDIRTTLRTEGVIFREDALSNDLLANVLGTLKWALHDLDLGRAVPMETDRAVECGFDARV